MMIDFGFEMANFWSTQTALNTQLSHAVYNI